MEEPASEPEEVDEAGEAAEATWAAPAAAAADGAAMAAALVEAASTARRAASLRARGLLPNLRARNIPASPSAREQRNQHSLLQSGSYLRRRWVTAYAYQQVHMYVKKSFMTTAVHPPFTGSLKFMQRPFGPSVRTVFVQQMRQFRQQLLCRYRRQPVSVTMSTVRIPAETPFCPQLFLRLSRACLGKSIGFKNKKMASKKRRGSAPVGGSSQMQQQPTDRRVIQTMLL